MHRVGRLINGPDQTVVQGVLINPSVTTNGRWSDDTLLTIRIYRKSRKRARTVEPWPRRYGSAGIIKQSAWIDQNNSDAGDIYL